MSKSMEEYFDFTVVYPGGVREKLYAKAGSFKWIQDEYKDVEYWSRDVYSVSSPAIPKLSYINLNGALVEMTLPSGGSCEVRVVKGNLWWVEFKVGNDWKRCFQYHDKLMDAITDMAVNRAPHLTYRINGGKLNGKPSK